MKRTITKVLAIILIVVCFALLEIMENTEISPAIQNIIAVISAFVIPFVHRFAFPLFYLSGAYFIFNILNFFKKDTSRWSKRHDKKEKNVIFELKNRDGAVLENVEYNENAKCIKSTSFDEDGNITDIWEYDKKGNKKSTYFDEKGNITDIWEYDKKGNKKSTYFDEDGNITDIWEYDKKGNKKKTYFYENGKITTIKEYTHDEQIEKSTYFDENGNITDIWEYNKNEKKKKITYYENGEVKEIRYA